MENAEKAAPLVWAALSEQEACVLRGHWPLAWWSEVGPLGVVYIGSPWPELRPGQLIALASFVAEWRLPADWGVEPGSHIGHGLRLLVGMSEAERAAAVGLAALAHG